MKCPEIKQSLYSYLDGHLEGGQEHGLYRHLASCPACRKEMVQARQLHQLLEESLVPLDPPAGLVQGVLVRLPGFGEEEAATAPAVVARYTGKTSRSWKSWLVAGWAALLVLAGALGNPAGIQVAQVPQEQPDQQKLDIPQADIASLLVQWNPALVSGPQQQDTSPAGEPAAQEAPAGGQEQEQVPASEGTTPGSGKDRTGGQQQIAAQPPAGDAPASLGRESQEASGQEEPAGTSPPAEVAAPAAKDTAPAVSTGAGSSTPGPQEETQTQPPSGNEELPLPETVPSGTATPPPPALPGKLEIASRVDTVLLAPLIAEEELAALNPVWSQDGQGLLYLSQRQASGGEYLAWKADNSGLGHKLWGRGVAFPVADGGGAWSPQRDRLALVLNRDGHREVWLSDASGQRSNLTPVPAGDVAGEYWAYWPVWSSQGELAFLTDRLGGMDIMVANTSGQTRILTESRGWELYPAWSPDGNWLAFQRTENTGSQRQDSLVVMDRKGGQERVVIPSMGGDSLVPTWSPDGKQLVVNVGVSEPRPGARQRGLWLVQADGSGLRQLTALGGGTLVNWSPDGRRVAFTDAAGVLYVVELNASGPVRVLQVTPEGDAGGSLRASWSPDSSQLVFDWQKPGLPQRGIWLARLQEGLGQ